MTRTIAYLRVSTEKQSTEGVSLEAQRKQVEAYASLYGLDLVAIVVETGSAASLDRPGLAGALADIAAGKADALLVTKLDRLTRSVKDLGHLIESTFAKAALMSVSEQIDTRTAGGRLVLNVLASVSQWERETIGERTSAAMQHMKASGEYTGGKVPFGKRVVDGKLVDAEDETEAARVARELKSAGRSLRCVSSELAARGIVSRTGRPFDAKQVARMLSAA